MAEPPITALLDRWGRGDASAFEQLIPLVYEELRRIAHNYMRKERGNHTLQATAIVHEAILRLAGNPVPEWHNRSQFYGISAQLMRRVLVDHARQSLAAKRGGPAQHAPLEDALDIPAEMQQEMVDVDRALERFAAIDPQKARIVEMRYFAGMSVEEVAEATGLSTATVKRAWSAARLWLHRELRGEP